MVNKTNNIKKLKAIWWIISALCIGVDNPLIILLFSTQITFPLHHDALKRVYVVIQPHLSLSFCVWSHPSDQTHPPRAHISHSTRTEKPFSQTMQIVQILQMYKSHTEKTGDKCVWAHLHVPLLSQLNIRSPCLSIRCQSVDTRHSSTAAPWAEAQRRWIGEYSQSLYAVQ